MNILYNKIKNYQDKLNKLIEISKNIYINIDNINTSVAIHKQYLHFVKSTKLIEINKI
jgi:hypothetical protein